MVKIYAMGLIFGSLLILTVPGVLYNNYAASGLAPSFSLSCPGYPSYACQNSNASGCQADPSSCGLSTASVSFLNQQSPFTDLVRGDFSGWFGYITGQGAFPSKSIWQVTPFGNNNLYPGTCYLYYNANATGPYGYQSEYCWQTNSIGAGSTTLRGIIPESQAILLTPSPGSQNTTAIHFYGLGVTNSSTYPITSSYLQATNCKSMIGFFFEGMNENFIAGCQFYSTTNSATTYWYYAVEVNSTAAWTTSTTANGGTKTYAQCQASSGYSQVQCPPFYAPVVVQPETWDVFDCDEMLSFPAGTTYHQDLGSGGVHLYNPLATAPISPQCQAVLQSINNFKGASSASGVLGTIFLWLGSIFLFILCSGINFQTSGSIFGSGISAGAGVNRQGTKFAQILGLSLVGFIPLYSEFSTWFTSGILPNGLDGTTGFVSIVIVAILFAGIIWQATQD